jgi:hypothetical protein
MVKKENKLGDYLASYLYKIIILLLTLLLSWLLISKIEFLKDMWQWVTTHFTEWSNYEDKFEFAIVTVIVVGVAGFGISGMFLIYWGIQLVFRYILAETSFCTVQESELKAKINEKVVGSYRSPGGDYDDIVEEFNLNLQIDGYKKIYKLTVPYDLFESLEKGQMIQVIESEYRIFGSRFDTIITLMEEEESDVLYD